ncbi:hypothetical protein [Acuticoccus sp.]|uniref:hypothetical protein n=1 Tax=Acuticoccus sp. TaxID=1904378 RepID=UPI003B52632A
MESGEIPIDLEKLSRPDAEAFRSIAMALGARFAGDLVEPILAAPVDPSSRVEPTPGTARQAIAEHLDPVRAAILERLPIAAVVILEDDRVALLNRAAATMFGVSDVDAVDGLGGITAVFAGARPRVAGLVAMRTAAGACFEARVTMVPIDWRDGRARLLTVLPAASPASVEPAVPGPARSAAATQAPLPGSNPVSPLCKAVHEVRRLVPHAAVLVVSSGDERATAGDAVSDDAMTRLLRAVLLGILSRARSDAVLTVRRQGAGASIDLPPGVGTSLLELVLSARWRRLADDAGCTVSIEHAALTVATFGADADSPTPQARG